MTIKIMITIEQLNKALEETSCWDTDFILNPLILDYSDRLEEHRYLIDNLQLSFWIWELFESSDSSTTLIYTWDNNNNIIIFQQWLDDFESLEDYCGWLNRMEEQALHINK